MKTALATRDSQAPAVSMRARDASHAADKTGKSSTNSSTNSLWQSMALSAQAKLTISQTNDPSEVEADSIADQVMRMPEPRVQRKCAACAGGSAPCPKCEEEQIQRKVTPRSDTGAGMDGNAVDSGFASRLGGGNSLANPDREFFESRMGADFSGVRIHTDAAASASAESIGARAYTLGNNIAFAPGEYNPGSDSGRHLLGHELVHVVQQQHAPPAVQRAPGPHDEEIERSRVSPGRIAGTMTPPSFSVYNFAINSAELKSAHYDFLEELADLANTGVIENIRLTGHTDSTGDDVINGPLSNDRAMAVEGYLSLLGASVASVTSLGAGSPVASNGTEAGRNRNRRVDIRYDIVSVPDPVIPEPEPEDPERPPPDDEDPPPGFDWPDFDIPCLEHPIICGLIGTGLFCIFFPEVCAAFTLPGWPDWLPDWPFDDDDPDNPDEPEPEEPEPPEPEEPESPLQCGDPELPATHVEFIPASGDKGNSMVAEPLTRCQGNTVGSDAKRSDPNWPHGWECVFAARQSHLWARAHLLHGPTLHGPGNDRRNIIIADKSINKQMSDKVELPAISLVQADEVLWYEVEVNHMTGDYPRPYFAESVHMSYGLLDPITGVRSGSIFDDTISSATNRVPPDCESTVDPPEDTDPPIPTPDPDPTPEDPDIPPQDDNPTCDEAELARRVDLCIEQAQQDAIDCTLGLLPFKGGWGGIFEGFEYYFCLDELNERLLECDRKAKEDTNCPDTTPPPVIDDGELIA